MRELALDMADEIVQAQSKDIDIADYESPETELQSKCDSENQYENTENTENQFDVNHYIETEL